MFKKCDITQKVISVLYTTVGTMKDAERLAKLAVTDKVAACVNITPGGRSIYFWNDVIEQNEECYMLFKTTSALMPQLEQWILKNHPYDVPAILKYDFNSSDEFSAYIEQSTLQKPLIGYKDAGDIILEENKPEIIKAKLQFELREFNRPFLEQYQRKNFAIYIVDQKQAMIAGLYGFFIMPHKAMRVEFSWVNEEHRGQGLGTRLFQYLEKYAHSKQCKTIQVSTGKWQGKEFYEKLGYKVIGVIPQWFCNQDEIFFSKELDTPQ